MKNIIKILTITVVLLSMYGLVSCATISRGNKSNVTFSSENGDILDITITDRNGEEVIAGQTPLTVELKKQAGIFKPGIYTVVASMPGSADSVTLELRTLGDISHFAWGAYLIGNFWNGGIGNWVDILGGASYKWQVPRVTEGNGTVSGILEKKEGALLISSGDGVVAQ